MNFAIAFTIYHTITLLIIEFKLLVLLQAQDLHGLTNILYLLPMNKRGYICYNSMALRYQLKKGQCAIFENLIEICGEDVASQLPCKNYCLEVAETILKDNNIANFTVTQDLEMPKDGACKFNIVKS